MNNFADKLIESIRNKKSCVCVGLDPKLDLMPQEIVHKCEGLNYEPRLQASAAIEEFCKTIINIVADDVVAIKPQSAFYEQYGWYGLQVLEKIMYHAKEKGLIVILDVKRSDIASTAEAYANAYFKTKGAYADAITVNPYMGSDSMEPFIKVAKEENKGIFVLLKTSNPGSKDFQDVMLQDGKKLYELIAEKIEVLGKPLMGKKGYSSIGAVVGATFPQEAKNIRELLPKTIFLVPGYGAQGAKAEDLKAYFNNDGTGAIINASRSIIYAYKNPQEKNWQDAVKYAVREMNTQINNIR
ncbi:MAG: orotidine-5'-phosphate decarboxylase [Planctomycetota bacterium]